MFNKKELLLNNKNINYIDLPIVIDSGLGTVCHIKVTNSINEVVLDADSPRSIVTHYVKTFVNDTITISLTNICYHTQYGYSGMTKLSDTGRGLSRTIVCTINSESPSMDIWNSDEPL